MYTDNDTGTTINVYMLYKNVHFNYYQGGAVPGVRSEGADDGQEEQTDEGEEGADDGQEEQTDEGEEGADDGQEEQTVEEEEVDDEQEKTKLI